MLADISAASGREVALFRLNNGTRVMRMGGVDFTPVDEDVARIIAHTHPSGRVSLSRFDVLAVGKVSRRRNVRGFSTVVIDPRSTLGARLPLSGYEP